MVLHSPLASPALLRRPVVPLLPIVDLPRCHSGDLNPNCVLASDTGGLSTPLGVDTAVSSVLAGIVANTA
jgi:hypothetical protein